MSAFLASGQSSPPLAKEMSRDDFDVALKRVQMGMDSISKDLQARRESAETRIQTLQSEMEELSFFNELDDSDDDDSESSGMLSLHVARAGGNDGMHSATYTFESFTAAVAAVAEAEDTNEKLKNQLKLSEKRSKISQEQVSLSELQQKDQQYRIKSLEQMLSLFQQRLNSVEYANASYEQENKALKEDLERTNHKLHDTLNIINESVEHVEALQSKREEQEVSLHHTQQLFSNALEEAKTHKDAAKALQASLAAAETKHAAEVAALQKQLSESNRDSSSWKEMVHSLRLSATEAQGQYSSSLLQANEALEQAQEKISRLESENKNFAQRVEALTKEFTDSEALHRDAIDEFKRRLDVASYKLSSSEASLSLERTESEHRKAHLEQLQQDRSKLRSALESTTEELRSCREALSKKEDKITELKSLLLDNDEELNNIAALFEDYKAKNDSSLACIHDRHKAEIESKQLQLEETQRVLETSRAEIIHMKNMQRKQNADLEEAKATLISREAEIISLVQHLEDGKKSLEQAEITQKDFAEKILKLEQSAKASSEKQDITISLLRRKLTGQEASISDLHTTKENLQKELSDKAECIQKLERQKEELDKELSSTNSFLDISRNELHAKDQTVKDLHTALSDNYKTISSLRVDLDRDRLQLSATEESLASTRLESEQTARELQRLRDEIIDSKTVLERRIATSQSSLDEAQKLLAERNEKIEHLDENLRQAHANEASLNDHIARIEQREAELLAMISSLEEQLAALQTSNAEQSSIILGMNDGTKELEIKISSMEVDRALLEESLVSLRQSEEEKSSEIVILRQKNKDTEELYHGILRKYEDISTRQAEQVSLVNEAQKLLAERNEKIEHLDESLRQAHANEASLNDHIARIEQREAELIAMISSLEEQLAALQTSNAEQSSVILGMKDGTKDMEIKISSMEADRALLEESLVALRQSEEEKSSEIIILLQKNKDIEMLYHGIQRKYEDISTRQAEQVSLVNDLRWEAESLEREKGVLQVQHLEQQSMANDLKHSVASLEREKVALQSTVGECNDRIMSLEVTLDRLLSDMNEENQRVASNKIAAATKKSQSEQVLGNLQASHQSLTQGLLQKDDSSWQLEQQEEQLEIEVSFIPTTHDMTGSESESKGEAIRGSFANVRVDLDPAPLQLPVSERSLICDEVELEDDEAKSSEISILRQKVQEIGEMYQGMQGKYEEASNLQREQESLVESLRQEVESLEQEKATLMAMVDTCDVRIASLESDKEALTSLLRETQESRENLESNVAATEGVALACQSNADAALSTDGSRMESELESSTRENAVLKTVVNECNDRMNLESDKESLSRLLHNTQEEHNIVISSLESKGGNTDDAAVACRLEVEQNLDSLEREKEALQTVVHTCNDRIKSLESEKDSLYRLLQEIQEEHERKVFSLECRVAAAEKTTQACQTMLDAANSKNDSIRADVEKLEMSLTATENIREELEHKVEKLESQIEMVEAERSSLESLLQACKESLIEMERSCSEKIDQANLKCNEAELALLRVSSVKENSAIFAHREIEKLKKQLKALEDERDEAKEDVEEMIERYELLENDLSSVEEELKGKDLELFRWKEECDRLLAEKDAKYGSIEKCLEEVKAKLEVAVSTKASLQNYVSSLVHDVKVKETEIDALKKNLAVVFPKSYSNQGNALSFQAKHLLIVDHLRESLQKKEDEVESLRILLEKKEERVTQLQMAAGSNEERIEQLQESIREKQEEIKRLEETVDDLQKQIQDLSVKNGKLAAVLDEFKAHSNEMNSKNTELYNQLDSYQTRCSELEKSLAEENSHSAAEPKRINMQPPLLERAQENGERRSWEPIDRRIQRTAEFATPEPADLERLSQARKNWEALKKEKAAKEEEKNPRSDRPSAIILQDDEFLNGRLRRSIRRQPYTPRIVSPEK